MGRVEEKKRRVNKKLVKLKVIDLTLCNELNNQFLKLGKIERERIEKSKFRLIEQVIFLH